MWVIDCMPYFSSSCCPGCGRDFFFPCGFVGSWKRTVQWPLVNQLGFLPVYFLGALLTTTELAIAVRPRNRDWSSRNVKTTHARLISLPHWLRFFLSPFLTPSLKLSTAHIQGLAYKRGKETVRMYFNKQSTRHWESNYEIQVSAHPVRFFALCFMPYVLGKTSQCHSFIW